MRNMGGMASMMSKMPGMCRSPIPLSPRWMIKSPFVWKR
ncbi:hypothetical protein ACNKHP_07130 [Shigella boydii]